VSRVCKRGHASSALPGGRYATGTCKECALLIGAEWHAENPAYGALWRAENPAYGAEWRAKSLERAKTGDARWRAENPGSVKASNAKWRAKNRGRCNAYNAHRRALKRKQTCTCCTREQLAKFHIDAHAAGREVDHVQPLALGGLECLKNLQALTPEEHKVKTFQFDFPLIAAMKRAA
jgi:hypothetical protein